MVWPTTTDVLSDVIESVLPDKSARWLLRAGLLEGAAGREAWEVWAGLQASYGQVLLEGGETFKAFQPLLYHGLRRNGASIPKSIHTHLKAALVREERRSAAYRQVVEEALRRLARSGVEVMVMGEALLAETCYSNPALRHCAGLQLLIDYGALERAAHTLDARTFKITGWDGSKTAPLVHVRHSSGMPLILQSAFLPGPHDPGLKELIWERGDTIPLYGVQVRRPALEDLLLEVCARAFFTGRCRGLFWAADGKLLLDKGRSMDWGLLARTARAAGADLVLGIMLGFLQKVLYAPLPPEIFKTLRFGAAAVKPATRDKILLGARLCRPRGDLRPAQGLAGCLTRLRLLLWTIFPSPDYVRWISGKRRRRPLPQLYLMRWLRRLGIGREAQ